MGVFEIAVENVEVLALLGLVIYRIDIASSLDHVISHKILLITHHG